MSILTVSNLAKSYRSYSSELKRVASWFGLPVKPAEEHWVLHDISFSINSGESVGLVGQNGAGKSTLLKMITGTLPPTKGSVQVNGRIAAILELGMGFNPEFTGRQNALHGLSMMGYSQAQIDQVMPELEAFAEIGEYFDQPVRTYSSGMQMRVAFGVATAFRPEILIVDEALSVGDSYFQAKCYARINSFKEYGTSLILVSHSAGDIVKHCERAIMLKNGRIELDGLSRDVSNRYLDELFGKKTGVASEVSKVGGSESLMDCNFLVGTEDVFNTRPGYRKEEHRWGVGGAAIIDYLIVADKQHFPSRIEGNQKTDFYLKVRFDADFENVVPGLLIKTLEGIFLYGTNSFVSSEGREHISVRSNEMKTFRFSLPLALNEGHYLVSFGISTGDPLKELVPLDRRYDAIILNVGKAVQFWGIVDLHASFDNVTT